jgi:enoyl-CoA hydratase/carnithine racemase
MELNPSSHTIDVPAVLNRRSLQELNTRLREFRACMLTLRGGRDVFCEGMDFAELASGACEREGIELYASVLEALRNHPLPVIAVVEGRAMAGGVGLVAACDAVLASDRATFTLSELLFGLIPAVVLPFLLERVPAQKARLWAMTARTLSAHEAREIGLVDDVGPPEQVQRTLHSWTRRLARSKPAAVASWKSLTARLAITGLAAATAVGVARMADPEVRSAVRQFVEEGVAPWH